jgi:hypothetical protein
MEVRPMGPDDRPLVAECARRAVGSPLVVSRGRLFDPTPLPGLVAWEAGHRGAVDRGRELKPETPQPGQDGMALRRTLKLESRLGRPEEGSA